MEGVAVPFDSEKFMRDPVTHEMLRPMEEGDVNMDEIFRKDQTIRDAIENAFDIHEGGGSAHCHNLDECEAFKNMLEARLVRFMQDLARSKLPGCATWPEFNMKRD